MCTYNNSIVISLFYMYICTRKTVKTNQNMGHIYIPYCMKKINFDTLYFKIIL